MKYLLLIAKNIGRNPLRSILTGLGTMVLVFVVTVVWSILALLDLVTTEKKENLKAIVSERWSIPSRMPFTYADRIAEGAADKPGDVRPLDSMTWQFYVGTLDPGKLTRENFVIGLAVEPAKLATMMDGLENLPAQDQKNLEECIDRLQANRQGIVLGRNQMVGFNKKVGERIKSYGIGEFKGLDLEFEVVGSFPSGRYDNMNAIHRDYFIRAMDAYAQAHGGRQHILAERNLSLVWLKLSDNEAFNRVAWQIENSPHLVSPAVKCETASSGIAAFLEGYRDLIWGVRWLLAPACLVSLTLVIANAISISVRERRLELAVLKVLGFRPSQILILVLGESLFLGAARAS